MEHIWPHGASTVLVSPFNENLRTETLGLVTFGWSIFFWKWGVVPLPWEIVSNSMIGLWGEWKSKSPSVELIITSIKFYTGLCGLSGMCGLLELFRNLCPLECLPSSNSCSGKTTFKFKFSTLEEGHNTSHVRKLSIKVTTIWFSF